MKQKLILMASALLIASCSGNKPQVSNSDTATTDTEVEEESTNNSANEADNEELVWGYISVGNDKLDFIENVDREEFYMAQEFLIEALGLNDEVDTYSEEWITAHCTPEMKQFLWDHYDFDDGGYAMWLFEGRFAGEAEYDTEVTGVGYGMRRGKPVYSVEKRYSFDGEPQLVRTLYFGLQRKSESFIITSFEINVDPQDPTVCE